MGNYKSQWDWYFMSYVDARHMLGRASQHTCAVKTLHITVLGKN